MKHKHMKALSVLLTVCLLVGLVPWATLPARATTEQYSSLIPTGSDDAAALAAKVVTFNGFGWYIIKDESTAADAGTITMFAKDNIGDSKFNQSKYGNAYNGSTIKRYLDNLISSSFFEMSDAIVSVDLQDVGVTGAKLWLLSTSEVEKLNVNIRRCSSNWWLRSPDSSDSEKAFCVASNNGGVIASSGLPYVDLPLGVRPALKLDLSKVEFNNATRTFSAIGQTVSVANMNLEPSTPQTIAVGDTVSFTASISPDEATDKTVKWKIGGTDAGALTLYSDPDCKKPLGSDATEVLTVYAKGSSTGNAIVTCFSNSDGAKFASCEVTVNTLQTQIEQVLTTITATGAMQANFSTENVASLDLLNAKFNEVNGWNGTDMTIEVTPREGYTITRCVFYDDSYHIATDSVAPFKVETQHLASTPYVNGEPKPIYEGSNGIKKIDVIGYYTGNSVTITPGSNMTKTLDSGDALQNGLSGAMTAVVYTADDGYYFPTGYNVENVNGISVTRDSYTQITVSGTPTADAAITLAEPTAKTKPDAPAVSAVNCTTAANNDGKLTGVTTAMEYKKSDATNWTVGTGNDITGLVPGTYYVRLRATDTALVSDNQELVISAYTVPGQVVAPVFNPAAGTYTEAQSVTISCETTGADIYYTTNGSEPMTSSTKYTGAISISATTTVKAIAVKSGMTNSAVASAVYTIKTSPVITKAPEAITGLVYNGKAQALITAGEVTGGTLYYAVVKAGDAEPSAELYTTSIPTAINAGSYYVWYKAVGSDGDVAPASIAVSIAKEDQSAPSLTSPISIEPPATTAEITGVTTAMEYSTDNKTWTTCADPFSVGKGVYYIRLKADANHNAGSAATVIVKGADEYALTVTGGTGSGGYEAGASVSVSATVPAGEKFVNWTPTNVTLTDEQKASATVTFTMPGSDVTLSANFEDLTVTGITLNKTSLSLAPNAAATLTVSYQPSGVKDTYKGVTWTSSNESVATVDGSGEVTAKAEGTAIITAKSTSNTSAEATCTVTVKKQSPTHTPTPSYDPTPSGRDDTPSTPSTPSTPAEDTHISETATGADGAAVTKEMDASTTTKKNSDGSTTVTDTVKETQTTESKDGTKVETATESTKAETTNSVKNSDGSVTDTTKVQNTETVKETATGADGSKTVTETKTEQEQNTAVTTKDNADGSKSEKTETTETVKVTEKVTDGSGKVTETVTTTKTETVTDMTAAQDGTATGTSKTTTTVTDDKGKVLSTTVTEAEIKASTDANGMVTTETAATTTTTDAQGNETVEKTVTTENKAPDGSTGTVVKDESGSIVSQSTTISQKEAEAARDEGRPAQSPLTVTPVPETVEDKAAPVQVNLPSLLYDKDGDSIVTVSEMPKVEIQVTYDGPGVVAKEYGADGTLRTVKECREGSVIVPVTGSGELVIVDNSKQFNDVNATDWYGEYVTFVTAREIFNGTGDGNFSPDATMTRAMLAQVLYNFARDSKAGNGAAFENVNAGDWFNAAVGWAYENGVVNGYGSSFGAQDNISRQDLATILYRFAKAAGYDVSKSASLDGFADAGDVADYAKEAMRWAVGAGLINGTDGKLLPQQSATRAQVAAIMTRFVRGIR